MLDSRDTLKEGSKDHDYCLKDADETDFLKYTRLTHEEKEEGEKDATTHHTLDQLENHLVGWCSLLRILSSQ